MTEENEISQPETEETVAPPEENFKDKYLRLLAETENMRKRMQREKQEMMRFALENVLADIITPLDSFEQALQMTQQSSSEIKNWAFGFQMILTQFKEMLQQHGVLPFSSVGELFDPHRHEAVETEATDTVPDGTVLKEFVKGYLCGDRVIRPARVKVAKNLEKNEGEQ